MTIFDSTILQRRGLGKRILALLASRHPLPDAGIVAGQSVACAIDELYNLMPPVYNDIDVFLSAYQWHMQTGQEPIIYTQPSTKMLVSGVQFRAERTVSIDSEYARAFVISDRQLYTVRRARMDGFINRVWVDWYDHPYRKPEYHPEPSTPRAATALASERAQKLIVGFDLNSTQVAVDIRSGKLFYTPAFAQYFANRQLNIVCTFTPVQSLLRYLKKRNELNCYGNDEAHIELVRRLVRMNEFNEAFRDERVNTFLKGRVQFTQKALKGLSKQVRHYLPSSVRRVGTGIEGAPLAFGKKYAGLLDQYGNVLKPFFDTTHHPKKELFLFSSRDDAPPLPERDKLPVYEVAQPRRFWQMYLPAGKLATLRRDAFRQFLEGLNEDAARRYERAYSVHGDAFLEGAESPSGMKELLRSVNEHQEVLNAFVEVSFGLQIEVVRLVRAALKKANIPEAWGLFSGRTSSWLIRLLKHPEMLDEDIKKIKGFSNPVVEALPLPTHEGTVEVLELRSALALRLEGSRMRHCVGGYIRTVEEHRCRIISLKAGPSATHCSTVDWEIVRAPKLQQEHAQFGQNPPLQLELAQHYTFANGKPLAKLRTIEMKLRKEMNGWLLAHPREGYDLLRPGAWQA